MTQEERIRAVAATAEAWRDPDHPARAAAVDATLEAPNRYTEEGLAFALNHRMHQATPEALGAWVGEREAERPVAVGVVCTEDEPLAGWEAVLGAFLLGHRVVVAPPVASPVVLRVFWAEVEESLPRTRVAFGAEEEVRAQAESVIASDEKKTVGERDRVAVAVIDGREDTAARSGLAEDLLLHEGVGSDAPRIVWAPAGQDPDPLLDALAGFREVFPPHPDTDGTFAFPAAFLASAKQAHAVGSGFLVSKGEPEPQAPGHVRWSEYETLAEVAEWLRAESDVSFVVARPEVAERLETERPVVAPGDAHRRALGERHPDLIEHLAGS